MDQQRSGHVVLVTGGGSGIGRATAHAFADQGATVLITGRRDAVLEDAREDKHAIHAVAADVTCAADLDRLHREVARRWGKLDVLVNNAGLVGGGPLIRHNREESGRVVATNLVAPIHVTTVMLPLLLEAKGTVVNVSTTVGQRAWPGSSTYAATKAALESLTRSWAVELAPAGVRVVCVAPGAIRTDIGAHNGLSDEQVEQLREWQVGHTPLGRLGEPAEVANAILGSRPRTWWMEVATA